MFPYVEESFTAAEEAILRRYVTNLDLPVFALVNLPEVVKGALFARYSRSSKSLRRLFLDEFVGDLDVTGDITVDATVGLKRAEELYERVFFEYGDDSVAQLGGVHLACEQSSNVLSKVLERGRLMAYLEQSTRYIGYDSRLPSGHYRYYRPPEILESALGARYVGDLDRMFDTYADLLPRVQTWLSARYPRDPADSDLVHRRAVRAKALDAIRGLLPAASLSNIGMYGTGQSYELLLLRMRTHPLPEARHYADMMLAELRKVIPSFLQRIDQPDRGGEWSGYLAATRDDTARVVERLWPGAADGAGPATGGTAGGPELPEVPEVPEVTLLDFDPEGEDKVLAAICFPHTAMSDAEALRRVGSLSTEDRAALLAAYVGERRNRRHRPGRAFERTEYRFEVTTDYGAFRDLQRHRLLTVEWQPLGVSLGHDLPAVVVEAGLEQPFVESIERSRELHSLLAPQFPAQAPYAVALGFRIRFILQMNAREAMHLIELRSGPQGHPAYRRVAQQMHRAIEEVAGHGGIARSMVHVDHGATDLERLDAERRAERRRGSREVGESAPS
ncbi:MAG TPA: FAD-dependent thymidylate synthase [Acidimicrobiales bacterium]|nr:FAD-dependent thymidylate synthase [Acidimicrobiales bacterium]